MSRHTAYRRRRGATAVEFAVACPIVFFLIFATIVGGLGVFRYQQVASLAREGARYASVHGADYEEETGNAAATPEEIFNEVIKPLAVGLHLDSLSCVVTWDKNNQPLYVENDVQTPTGNTVTVTVNYQWFPELYLVGPYNLTSTSTAQMMY
jgi:Flp pilus assembly protein TadG